MHKPMCFCALIIYVALQRPISHPYLYILFVLLKPVCFTETMKLVSAPLLLFFAFCTLCSFFVCRVVTQRDAYAGHSDNPRPVALCARHAVKGRQPLKVFSFIFILLTVFSAGFSVSQVSGLQNNNRREIKRDNTLIYVNLLLKVY